MSFVSFYTDSGYQIIVISLTCAYCLYFGLSVAYDRPMTSGTFLVYLMVTFCVVLMCVTLGIILKYVIEVRHKLRTANVSHVKLLHGMHEGLLIVDQESDLNSKPWLFFNRPASKLINTFLGKLDNNLKGDKEKRKLN